jgi:putative heme-binding domain-containing protein
MAEAQATPKSDRIEALRLLGRRPHERSADIELLANLIAPQTAGDVQSAAVVALGRTHDERAAQVLLNKWSACGPTLRQQVLDLLMSRPAWTAALLAAIEEKRLSSADIDAAHRQRLLESKNEEFRSRAAKLLAASINADRQRVVTEFDDVLRLTGDVSQGKKVFEKRCAVCHQLGGMGHAVGPDLAALSDKSSGSLLVAVLDPNRAVEAKFANYAAVTNDGLNYSGILVNETGSSVTLLGQEGKQQVLFRSNIELIESTGKSLMPEGLEKDATRQELADVFAFVRSAGSPPKTVPRNRPEVVHAGTGGAIELFATNAEIYGPTLTIDPRFKSLSAWKSQDDHAAWSVDVASPGRYRVLLTYACTPEGAGNDYALEAGGKTLVGRVTSSGSSENYQQIELGQLDLPSGAQRVVFRPSGPVRGALLDLGALRLAPLER